MPKLILSPSPTFSAKVKIPVHGGDDVPVEFVFKHRTGKQFSEWLKTLDGKEKDKAIQEMVSGWELEDEFNSESINTLMSNYLGSFDRILSTYIEQITQAKLGN